MILSNVDIRQLIKNGKITIDSYDDNNIYPASYAFTLGHNLLRPIGEDVIDLKKNLLPEYEEIYITEENGYTLQPEEFILGQTHEKITLSEGIAMTLEGRTNIARMGVEVVQTATFIEPTHFQSIITLEIKNNGKNPVVIYPRMKFCRGVFHQLLSPSTDKANQSSYKTQHEVEPPRNKGYI